ncbi:MAG: DUF1573 domain-containing protein [Verrucomicrobiaceae bacterium]|nr:MAG: DUF1573 domain-containing protein [Verrucomicrobiaceae bacterium]
MQEFHRTPKDKFVEAKFSFKNTGASPVTIKNIRTSCGCTSADLEKKTYAPGEEGHVAVKFNFGGRLGGQRKTIRVFASDQPDDPMVLDLRVYITEPVTVSPSLVFWRVGEANAVKNVRLQMAPGQPVKVKGVTSNNPRVTAALQTVKAGEQYVIAVKAADTTLRESAEIQVATDFPPDAPRTYTIHARIK